MLVLFAMCIYHHKVIFGEIHPRPTTMNIKLAEEIKASQDITRYNTVLGATMCTDDFYEGQGRIDGAACDFDSIKQREYLEKLKANGVVNIEMEATAIASLCLKTGVRCAIVCVTLLDRLKGDQVDIPPADYQDYQERPQNLVATFIKKDLSKTQP
jgi:uridine phosphorylase